MRHRWTITAVPQGAKCHSCRRPIRSGAKQVCWTRTTGRTKHQHTDCQEARIVDDHLIAA